MGPGLHRLGGRAVAKPSTKAGGCGGGGGVDAHLSREHPVQDPFSVRGGVVCSQQHFVKVQRTGTVRMEVLEGMDSGVRTASLRLLQE